MGEAFEQAGIAAASSALTGLACSGTKKIWKFLKIKYSHVKHTEKNFAKLEEELNALRATEEEMLRSMPESESLLEEVKKIKYEVMQLETEYKNLSARNFLVRLYLSPKSVELGKRIVEKTEELVSLKSQIKGEMTRMVETAPTSILWKICKFFRNWMASLQN